MSLLSKLGFSIGKVKDISHSATKDNADVEDPALKALKLKRQARYDKDTEETATLYASWLPVGMLTKLCDMHNFMHIHWGSRKTGRLMNICRNILDIEMSKENNTITREQTNDVLKLFLWCSLLYPITILWGLRVESIDDHFRSTFEGYLKEAGVTKDERNLILHAVFNPKNTTPGNVVLDVWHDAVRFEDSQFDYPYIQEHMRTDLGKNKVFYSKVKRDSSSNLSPHWLMLLQEIQGETRFTNEDVTFTADKTSQLDSIT